MSEITDRDKDNWTTGAMALYGGSFVKGLGQLWRAADLENQRKLKGAFPELWEKYGSDKMIAKAKRAMGVKA